MPYSVKPAFPASDTKCPDGFACYGWRQIHKGGYINWYGRRYFHEDLKGNYILNPLDILEGVIYTISTG